MNPRRVLPLALLATAAAAAWFLLRPSDSPAPLALDPVSPAAPPTGARPTPPTAPASLRDAADFARIAPDDVTPAVIAAAAERREAMARLMRDDPARALAESISWTDHAALPESLLPYFEKPFNSLASLDVLPVCSGESHEPVRELRLADGTRSASVLGARLGQDSKVNAPLRGITLGERAVVADDTLQILSAADAATLAGLPLANPDASRDFATGAPLAAEPVVALAGGERFLFNSAADVAAFNTRLAALDARPGPHGGSRVLFALPAPADPSAVAAAGFDWSAAETWVELQASAWTETPKTVLFIRVDFPDLVGESTSQAALAGVINTTVTETISAMSYGKTSMTATVSPQVVRMPNPATAYAPSNNDALHTDAMNAYKALAGANALDGYDIVGVHFASIGMQGNGLTYAGLAGGSRQWLQGTTSASVIVHEFGHNYGLGHSSLWQTTDGSVVGSGASVEYGDPFDIMGGGSAPAGHFHPQGKARLNWLTTSQWTDTAVAGSGMRRVYRFDSSSTATGSVPRGLRVLKGGSNNTAAAEYYWIGYRPGLASNAWLPRGAYLLWEQANNDRSWLLDLTPGSSSGSQDSPLLLGRTYSDAVAGVHITPVAVGGSGADAWLDVNVQLGAFPGNAAPSATFAPVSTVVARSPQTFSVSASDPNGDTLAYGWDFADSSAPDNAASLSHSWIVGGSYPVNVTVSDMKGGVVARNATVTVTDPLDTWTSSTITAGRSIDRLAYLDGRHIATGNRYAYFSLDGQTWSSSELALNFNSGGIATDGASFVVAGMNHNGSWIGAIFRSDDGRAWQPVSIPAGEELRAVAASPSGVFVAVGDSGRILRSTDGGATWATIPAPGSASLAALAYGGGRFMAVGGTSIYTSPDGLTWTDRSTASLLESWHSFDALIYADGAFHAGGWYSGIHRSTDGGVTWTKSAILDNYSYDIDSIAAGPGVLVASATRRTSPTVPALLVSADGLRWKESTQQNLGVASRSLSYAAGVFAVSYGSDGQRSRTASLISGNQAPTAAISGPTDGNARTAYAFFAAATDADGDPLTLLWDFGDGSVLSEGPTAVHAYAAGGSYTVTLTAIDQRGGVTTATRAFTAAEPLATWTQLTSGTTAQLNDIASGGGRLVAVGDTSGTYRWSADSGVTWNGGTLGINIALTGVIHDGARFVAVGYNYDFGISAWVGEIYTSPDGTTWTRRYHGGEELRDVAYSSGRYISTGDAGTILTSTDSVTWNSVASGVSVNLHSVTAGPSGFVVAGAAANSTGGTVLVSSDGLTWTDTSSGLGTGQGLFEAEYLDDRFLVSGFHARIRHSTNGGASFSTTMATNRRAYGFARAGGVYLAVGVDQLNTATAVNLLSLDGATWTDISTAAYSQRQAVIAVGDVFYTVGASGQIWRSAPVTPATGGFANWLLSRFPSLPPGSSAPGDDPDGDGVPNLVEYATGTDPKSAASRPNLEPEVVDGVLTLTVAKSALATDVVREFKTSTDLADWTTSGVTVDSDADTLVAMVPIDGPRRFLRLIVTLNN